MCRFLKIITFLLLFLPFFSAQEAAAPSPEKLLHNYLGVGLGAYTNQFGPWLQYDFGLTREWSLGAALGALFTYSSQNPSIFLNLRGSYHFNTLIPMPKTMDWYLGASIGPALRWNLESAHIQAVLHLGYRYFFHRHFGLQIEAVGGFNLVGLNAGVNWKL